MCHYIGQLSKASKAGMRAALADCPKCHFNSKTSNARCAARWCCIFILSAMCLFYVYPLFTIALHYKNSHKAVEPLIKFAPSVVVHRPVETRLLASRNTSTGQWKHVYWPVNDNGKCEFD